MRNRSPAHRRFAACLLASGLAAQDPIPWWDAVDARSLDVLLAEVSIDADPGADTVVAMVSMQPTVAPLLLELRRASHRTPGFVLQVVDQDGIARQVTPPPVSTYRGVVRGMAGSHVECSITPAGLTGTATLSSHQPGFAITPVGGGSRGTSSRLHLMSIAPDVRSLACGHHDGHGLEPWSPTPGGAPSQNSLGVADIVVDTDREFFARHGDQPSLALSEIEDLVNRANAYFESRTMIRHRVMAVVLRSTAGPYVGTTSEALVNALRSQWLTVAGYPRVLAYLVSAKSLQGPYDGQVYYRGAPCNPDKAYAMSTVRSFTAVQSAALMAHELGHIWSATHCTCSMPDCSLMAPTVGMCQPALAFDAENVNRILRYRATATCLRDEDIFVDRGANSPYLGTAANPYMSLAQLAAYPPVFSRTRIVIAAGIYPERALRLHTPMVLAARNGSARLGR